MKLVLDLSCVKKSQFFYKVTFLPIKQNHKAVNVMLLVHVENRFNLLRDS